MGAARCAPGACCMATSFDPEEPCAADRRKECREVERPLRDGGRYFPLRGVVLSPLPTQGIHVWRVPWRRLLAELSNSERIMPKHPHAGISGKTAIVSDLSCGKGARHLLRRVISHRCPSAMARWRDGAMARWREARWRAILFDNAFRARRGFHA